METKTNKLSSYLGIPGRFRRRCRWPLPFVVHGATAADHNHTIVPRLDHVVRRIDVAGGAGAGYRRQRLTADVVTGGGVPSVQGAVVRLDVAVVAVAGLQRQRRRD